MCRGMKDGIDFLVLKTYNLNRNGKGVSRAGSGGKTFDGTPVRGSRVVDVSAVPAKNPTNSVVGSTSRDTVLCREIGFRVQLEQGG